MKWYIMMHFQRPEWLRKSQLPSLRDCRNWRGICPLMFAAFRFHREWWPPDGHLLGWRAPRHHRPLPRGCRRVVAKAVWGPGKKKPNRPSRRALLRKALSAMCAFEARFIAGRSWTRKQRVQLRKGHINRVHLASRVLLRMQSSGSRPSPPHLVVLLIPLSSPNKLSCHRSPQTIKQTTMHRNRPASSPKSPRAASAIRL